MNVGCEWIEAELLRIIEERRARLERGCEVPELFVDLNPDEALSEPVDGAGEFGRRFDPGGLAPVG